MPQITTITEFKNIDIYEEGKVKLDIAKLVNDSIEDVEQGEIYEEASSFFEKMRKKYR